MGELPNLKTSTKIAAVAIPLALMLVGAGCMNRLGKDAAAPVTVPVEALGKSQEEIDAAKAKQAEEAAMAADDLMVAFIHSDNADAKAEVVEGQIGCGDKVAYWPVHREAQTDSVISDALTTLFSVREPSPAGLYNSLWESKLSVDKIQSRDGVTTEVWLKGSTVSGGACDDPRIKAQIEYTIKRYKPNYKIFLNGSEADYRCLGDMSGECK